MEWQHYNNLKATMQYIEKLLREIEASLDREGTAIFNPIDNDLTKEQAKHIKKEIMDIYHQFEQAKAQFDLHAEPIKLSRIIDVNTGFIWKTVEDAWSYRMEMTSGKITSIKRKRQIDDLLNKILESTNKIRETVIYKEL